MPLCGWNERTRETEIKEDDFVQFYPYPPHYIDICIGIMSGIRLQPGAPRHYGGSNRTIIKQAYEMLVSERTNMAAQPIGTLGDARQGVRTGRRKPLQRETHRHPRHQRAIPGRSRRTAAGHCGWPRSICLLEFLRDLPRTEANIAALLVDQVGEPCPGRRGEGGGEEAPAAQFIRNTEDGWKLQTAQEKNWETERRGYLEPKPRERNEMSRNVLREIFGEAGLQDLPLQRFANLPHRHQRSMAFRLGMKAICR